MEDRKLKIINPNEYGSLLYNKEENNAILNVMNERRIFRYSRTEYSYVNWFENEIIKKMNTKNCLGVINGTAGLITALKTIDVKPNDKVLVSSYTYIATALAVKLVGAIPIPLNIDLKNGININELKYKVDKSCKAVIVTHLQGRCFNLDKVCSFVKNNNMYLIEDACQGFASQCNGKYAGTYGDIGIYSFQQFKQISSGEGGAIVTNNKDLYVRARNYTDMGSVRDRFPNWNSDICLFGQNYRMNNLIGAILFEQIKKIDYMIEKQHISRNNILNKVKEKVKINYIESEFPAGDTGMNIIFCVNQKSNVEKIINYAKEKYNVELRKMWSGLYFDNELFKKQNIDDWKNQMLQCNETKKMVSTMLVMPIPPILDSSAELIMSKLLIELKSKGFIE